MRGGPTVLVLVCAASLMIGCDKSTEQDELREALAAAKKEVADSKAQIAALNARLTSLESSVSSRLAIVEAAQTQASAAGSQDRQALSDEHILRLKSAISQCVHVVRSLAQQQGAEGSFWSGFDAFYNPGTGRIQNNVVYNGGRPALYVFNKCMATEGFPMS